MSPRVRIFISIFCYVTAVCGLVLAVANASQRPPATATAILFGTIGALAGLCGVYLTRRPRY